MLGDIGASGVCNDYAFRYSGLPVPGREGSGVKWLGLMKKRIMPRRMVYLRRLHGLSQEKLGRRAGVSQWTVSSIESGLHDPLCSTIELIAEALCVFPGYLLGSDPEFESASCPGTIPADRLYTHYATLKQGLLSVKRCIVCSQELAVGIAHGAGDCILALYESGKSKEFIAVTFGICLPAIDAILDAQSKSRAKDLAYPR